MLSLLKRTSPEKHREIVRKLGADLVYLVDADGPTWYATRRGEQCTPPGDWLFWLILAGRGWGKALALDTPIPTPSGWTTMGELRVGDEVFDERGMPCRVTFATEVMHGHTCYDVVFSDGTVITADAEHQWLTVDRRTRKALARRTGTTNRHDRPQSRPRYAPGIVTTEQIAATLYDGREVNHAVPTCEPIVCPTADLPIDPYVLGVWLGDGHSAGASITTADAEILAHIERAGYAVRPMATSEGKCAVYSIGATELARDPVTGQMMPNGSLHSALKALGLRNHKHIPVAYLRASEEQRLALLQGLMDTDGSVESCGRCEFMSTNHALAAGVYELVAGLGMQPRMTEERATLDGEDYGPRWRVRFTAHRPVFRLSRKLARQHTGKAQRERVKRRYIVEVRPRPSVPVRCIQVDSPSHLFLASRAFIPTHNTRTGAEFIRDEIMAGRMRRVAIVGRTAADVRDVMIEGPSGILAVCHRFRFPALYEPSKRKITFGNGAIALARTAEEPDALRGPEWDGFWCDELAAWKTRKPGASSEARNLAQETWDNLMFGFRQGRRPRGIITTTPRPVPLVKALAADPRTHLTRGSTFDNAANLAPTFLADIRNRYEGTRLGRQELYAEILEDVEGALWTLALIDEPRVSDMPRYEDGRPKLARVVVAVDPATTHGPESDATGIAVVGLGYDGDLYVLAAEAVRLSPLGWAMRALALADQYGAGTIVFERNQGGEMVEHTLRNALAKRPGVPPRLKAVVATKGKQVRAEPVAALYEQGRVHHVGVHAALEDQMIVFPVASERDDLVDALVWAVHELMPATQPGALYVL